MSLGAASLLLPPARAVRVSGVRGSGSSSRAVLPVSRPGAARAARVGLDVVAGVIARGPALVIRVYR